MRAAARVRHRGGAAALLLSLLAVASPAAAGSLGLALKATFLVKFAPFVEWPPSAFATPDSPVTICAMADDPLLPLLEQAAAGQKDGNRALAVRKIAPGETAAGCNVFYFEPDSRAGRAIAATLQNAPVLTATSEGVADAPAIVTFVVDQNRVHFDIDNAAALRARLEIGSNLLALARNVKAQQ